jgi:hypothetical protein
VTVYNKTITRVSSYTQSFDVYAKPVFYPTEDGDGNYVLSATINPWQSSVNFAWTSPDGRPYFFRVVPVTRRTPGLGFNL